MKDKTATGDVLGPAFVVDADLLSDRLLRLLAARPSWCR